MSFYTWVFICLHTHKHTLTQATNDILIYDYCSSKKSLRKWRRWSPMPAPRYRRQQRKISHSTTAFSYPRYPFTVVGVAAHPNSGALAIWCRDLYTSSQQYIIYVHCTLYSVCAKKTHTRSYDGDGDVDDGSLISTRDLDMPPRLSLCNTRLNLMPTNPTAHTSREHSLSCVGLHKVILLQVYEGFMCDCIGDCAATALGSVDWENIYGRGGVRCRRELSALLVLLRIPIPRALSLHIHIFLYTSLSTYTPTSLAFA